MRRLRLIAVSTALAGLVLSSGTPASAAVPGQTNRPKVTIVGFYGPVRGVEGREWRVVVNARDKDGVIWEVDVLWGDGSESWATTGCVQGRRPGTLAHLVIPHTYVRNGPFLIQARAQSYQRCPFDGPAGRSQESRPAWKLVVVRGA